MKDDPRVVVNVVSSRMLHDKLETLVVLVEAGKSNNLLWTDYPTISEVKSNCKVIFKCPRRFDLRTRLVRSNLNILSRFDSWRMIFLKLQ